jgi:N-acetylneuraminic acid mutarotase
LIPIRHRSIITPAGRIFLTGGSEGDKELNSAYEYDPRKNDTFRVLKKMNTARKSHGICYLHECIYVIGGFSNFTILDSCEKYDINSDKWTKIDHCLFRCTSPSITTFHNRYIFKIGGLEDENGVCAKIESYDVEVNAWKAYPLKDISTGLDYEILWLSASCQINNNEILVMGGVDESQHSRDSCYVIEISPSKGDKSDLNLELIPLNDLKMPYQAGFWNGQCIFENNKLWVLQNVLGADLKVAREDARNILEFDGSKWNIFS